MIAPQQCPLYHLPALDGRTVEFEAVASRPGDALRESLSYSTGTGGGDSPTRHRVLATRHADKKREPWPLLPCSPTGSLPRPPTPTALHCPPLELKVTRRCLRNLRNGQNEPFYFYCGLRPACAAHCAALALGPAANKQKKQNRRPAAPPPCQPRGPCVEPRALIGPAEGGPWPVSRIYSRQNTAPSSCSARTSASLIPSTP
jgi:hypothetical protein